MLVCPIVKAGRVFGALQLKNKKSGAFDEGDLAVLSYLAHHAANYLERRELEQPFGDAATRPPAAPSRRPS
jgi:GAF domain-containing protein